MTEQSNVKQSSKNPQSKSFERFAPLRLDIKSASQMHRKNLEVCSKTYKTALETAKKTQQQNARYAKAMMEEMKNQIRTIRKAPSQEERFKARVECLKQNFEKAVTHSREVTSMWEKTSKEIGESLTKQFNDNLENAPQLLKKKME